MTRENPIKQGTKGPITKRMLVGAAFGLILTSAFLLNADHVDPPGGSSTGSDHCS